MTSEIDPESPITQSPEEPPRTNPEVREVTQELLKAGLIDLSEKQELYQSALRNQPEIVQALEPLDLSLSIDERRGLMIVSVRVDEADDADEPWAHPLIRRQRLTLEQSLLVAILRQHFVVQELELGTGIEVIKMPMDILIDQMFKYLPDSGSDSKNERRILSLVEKLKTHGVVTEPDKNQEITIRPLISHLANPSTLKALLEQLRSLADSQTPGHHDH